MYQKENHQASFGAGSGIGALRKGDGHLSYLQILTGLVKELSAHNAQMCFVMQNILSNTLQ
jgi:hypothetical protein